MQWVTRPSKYIILGLPGKWKLKRYKEPTVMGSWLKIAMPPLEMSSILTSFQDWPVGPATQPSVSKDCRKWTRFSLISMAVNLSTR